MKTKHTLAAAAIAGLLAGTATSTYAASNTSNTQAGVKISTMADKDTHSCKGKNACKGQGGCKTDSNACKGHNECKGKGGCATDGSKK